MGQPPVHIVAAQGCAYSRGQCVPGLLAPPAFLLYERVCLPARRGVCCSLWFVLPSRASRQMAGLVHAHWDSPHLAPGCCLRWALNGQMISAWQIRGKLHTSGH